MNGSLKRLMPVHDLASDNDVPIITSSNDGTPLQVHVKESLNLRKVLKDVYHKYTTCSKILAHPEEHLRFGIRKGLIWTKNQLKQDVICISKDVFQRGRWLV